MSDPRLNLSIAKWNRKFYEKAVAMGKKKKMNITDSIFHFIREGLRREMGNEEYEKWRKGFNDER